MGSYTDDALAWISGWLKELPTTPTQYETC